MGKGDKRETFSASKAAETLAKTGGGTAGFGG